MIKRNGCVILSRFEGFSFINQQVARKEEYYDSHYQSEWTPGPAGFHYSLEKELTAKTGKDVALVAYSPVKYAALSDDAEALAKITELELLLSKKTGKDIVLVAFSI